MLLLKQTFDTNLALKTVLKPKSANKYLLIVKFSNKFYSNKIFKNSKTGDENPCKALRRLDYFKLSSLASANEEPLKIPMTVITEYQLQKELLWGFLGGFFFPVFLFPFFFFFYFLPF